MKKLIALILCTLMLLPTCVYAKDELPFTDAQNDSWYRSSLKYDYINALICGTSKTTFSPSALLTREMMVSMLANIDKADLTKYEGKTSFEDVETNRWYSSSIEWAYQNKICFGVTASLFGLGKEITREEMATMLYNYAVVKRLDTSKTSELFQFKDIYEISDWAFRAVQYAVGSEFMCGVTDDTFAPKETADRASVAVLIHLFNYRKSFHLAFPDTSYADALQIEESNTPRIICWGDSLTQGLGSTTPYPDVIESITEVETVNMGIASETAEMIAMRQGAIPVYAMPGEIPSGTSQTPYDFYEDYNNPSYLGLYGKTERGINDISVNGISGKITTGLFESYFKRTTPGEAMTLTKPTRIITSGMALRRSNDISVFFLGANNKYAKSDSYELVEIINKMIKYSGNDRYVVVSLTPKCMLKDLDYTNKLLSEAYKEHYVPFREYLITDALRDLKITPTKQDLKDLEMGEIPESLRSDNCHGNQLFYDICAKMISEKIDELGYLD